jgi:uncharacterized protein (DUF2126 family)
VAAFWAEPYPERLVRWGTELHDRFLLPHFVKQDFQGVLHDLQGRVMTSRRSGSTAPFRIPFPQAGRADRGAGHALELRQAIEPWHGAGRGTGSPAARCATWIPRWSGCRSRCAGFNPDRYQCHLQRAAVVPLHPTGTRANLWPACATGPGSRRPACILTIGVHTPLIFDVHDTWNGRAVAGCTYHVAHPGGRNYTTFPVNGLEAESRRIARFFPFGHTPGASIVHPERRSREFPMTLDLRRADW